MRGSLVLNVASSFCNVVDVMYLFGANGYRSRFTHQSKRLYSKNHKVTKGQKIALSGNSGKNTTGPHLLYGIYLNGTAIDPLSANKALKDNVTKMPK